MGESTSEVDTLRYIYFTEESVQNGPKCHSCMNDDFCSTELDAIEHVFVMTEAGLVPFLIRSLVFLYGMDSPFSLKNISERLFITQCVDCSMSRDLPVAGDAKFCVSTLKTSQEVCEAEKDNEQDVVTEVVESMLHALSTLHYEGASEFPENISEVSKELSDECNFIHSEHERSSNEDTCVAQSTARDNLGQEAVPNKKKRRIRSDAAVTGAKRANKETEEVLSSGMITSLLCIQGNQVQTGVIQTRDGEEMGQFPCNTLVSKDVTTPSSSTCTAISSGKDHCKPAGTSHVIPLCKDNNVRESSTSPLERTLEQSDKENATSSKIQLPCDSRLPFGYGNFRQHTSRFVSFEYLFNFLTALKRTGKLDSGFNDFLLNNYPDVKDVNVCPHCGPLITENFTAIPHFLSIYHITKAMKLGRVFTRDLTVLKKLFRSYLQNSKCQDADVILQTVESAMKNKVYSKGSRQFTQLWSQIRNAAATDSYPIVA